VPGQDSALVDYEDLVLALLPEHGGRLVARARRTSPSTDGPYETQLIQFTSPDGFASYMADDRRTSLAAARDAAIERTELQHVDLI
jgi:uncharacterized protein (DUF1330 family)